MYDHSRAFTFRDLFGFHKPDRRKTDQNGIYDPILDPDLSFEHPDLGRILDYYRELAPQDALPSWDRFLPNRVDPRLLPHLLVLDTSAPAPDDFRWRLMGTGIVDLLERDTTGHTFRDLYDGDTLRRMLIAPLWVLSNRRPLRARTCGAFTGGKFRPSENLLMPFADGEGAITRILLAPIFDPVEPD